MTYTVVSFISTLLTNLIVVAGALSLFSWLSHTTRFMLIKRHRVATQLVSGILYTSYLVFESWSTTVLDPNAFGMHWTYLNMIAAATLILTLAVPSWRIVVVFSFMICAYYFTGTAHVTPAGVLFMLLGIPVLVVIHRWADEIRRRRLWTYGAMAVISGTLIAMVMAMTPGTLTRGFWVRQILALSVIAIVTIEYDRTLRRITAHSAQLSKQAARDSLTGLPHFSSFTHDLQKAFATYREDGVRYSVLEFDIDFFKHINDTYGHPAGNTVLMAIAGIARDIVADLPYAAQAYRLGGEEFALLLHAETTPLEEEQLADQLREAIANLDFAAPLEDAQLSVSVGAAVVAPANANYLSIYTTVDKYLYHVKRNGRNGLVVRGRLIRKPGAMSIIN